MRKPGGGFFIHRAERFAQRPAVGDASGSHSYAELLEASSRIAASLLRDRNDLQGERVAFRMIPGFAWVATLWGVWRAGGIAVPLPLEAPAAELEYYIGDSQPSIVIFDDANEGAVAPLAAKQRIHATLDARLSNQTVGLPEVERDRSAMILYTSGTTSRPKGVVTTHANIAAQIATLVEAWEWSAEDRILLCLPLHHVHGIINVVGCALWEGALCEMLPRFDANVVWERIANDKLTLFMAVPTIYAKLISTWEGSSPERRQQLSETASRLRLMVSGSAALPVSTLERWKEITGHTLLERYGMTEIGMALSNAYRGDRIPGSVGRPLPGVQVRIVSDDGRAVPPGTAGEMEVRGASVFREYWNRPDATRHAFREGWFRTGDTVIVENGVYRILGRSSIDIIKSGGHKISALEVEEVLRQHPAIMDCAVVGVPDEEWGERVSAAVVLRAGERVEIKDLREWCKQRMSNYKAPSRLLCLEMLPRNAMGKVTKTTVTDMFRQLGI